MAKVHMFFALGLLSCVCQGAKLPSNWKTCKMNDPKRNECFKNAIQKVFPDLAKGIPKLGVSTIDPLLIDALSVNQGSGPVSIDLNFKNFKLSGLKDLKIDNAENDWKTLVANVSTPLLTVMSQYKIGGKILVLPITGEGDTVLKLENAKIGIIFKIKERSAGGKKYYHIESIQLEIECNPLRLKFENLFQGNKQLGNQMNIFLNENWREIFQEVKPAVEEALSQAFVQIGNRLFSRVPIDLITPP